MNPRRRIVHLIVLGISLSVATDLAGQHRQQYLYFPLVVSGRAGNIVFGTELLVANTGSDAMIRLDAYNQLGQPWSLELAPDSPFIYETNLVRGRIFSGSGDPPEQLEGGYVVASVRSPDENPVLPGGTVVVSRYDGESPRLMTQFGVPAAPLLSEFTVKLDTRGSRDIGLAVVNPWSSSGIARLRITVWDREFEQIIASTQIELPLGSATSRFIWELFDDGSSSALADQLQEMEGIVTVVSDQTVAALTVQQTDDPSVPFPEEVPVLTVFPVIAGRADAAEITPGPEVDQLSVALNGRHYDVFHSQGDAVDIERQDTFFEWLAQQIGFSPSGRMQFFKYRDRLHMKRMTGFELTGLAPGHSLNIHSVKLFDTHETVHVFTDAELGVAIPLFIEGLAVAFSIDDPLAANPQPVWGQRHIHDVAREFVTESKLPALNSMVQAFGWVQLTANGSSYPAYPLAGSFVRFLVDEHGINEVIDFFMQSQVFDSVDETRTKFQAVFGVGLDAEWSRWQDFASTFQPQ